MSKPNLSRRNFFGATAAGALAGRAVAQSAGVNPGDLPDLTIKEVKVYVLKPTEANTGQGGANFRRAEQFASVVTASGIEGNYELSNRYSHSNWSNLGWLAYAKRTLAGKHVLDMPEFTSQWHSAVGQLSYASAMNNCLWDILGKAVNLPVYRILGAYRDRVRAYASSQHLRTVEAFVADVQHAKSQGFTAYKIHPPWLANNEVDYKLDIEVAKAVRKTGGGAAVRSRGRLHPARGHEGGPSARRVELRLLRRLSADRRYGGPRRAGESPGCPHYHGRVPSLALRLRQVHPLRIAGRGAVHRR